MSDQQPLSSTAIILTTLFEASYPNNELEKQDKRTRHALTACEAAETQIEEKIKSGSSLSTLIENIKTTILRLEQNPKDNSARQGAQSLSTNLLPLEHDAKERLKQRELLLQAFKQFKQAKNASMFEYIEAGSVIPLSLIGQFKKESSDIGSQIEKIVLNETFIKVKLVKLAEQGRTATIVANSQEALGLSPS